MKNEKLLTALKILGVIACLYLFLIGIGGMGAAFKGEFKETAAKLLEATRSPIVGLFIGILATTIVQSSSTTTSLIVGLVAAGAVDVGGAIFMVMGANIGTTVTAKIVSLGHITRKAEFRRAFAASSVHDTFNLITVGIMLPLEYSFHIMEGMAGSMGKAFVHVTGVTEPGNPLKEVTQPVIQLMKDALGSDYWLLIISVILTFIMLYGIVKLLQSLVMKKLESFFDSYLFRNAAVAFAVGLILTVMVQSSSITTSLIVPLAGAGVLRLQQIFPFTIGANIGTTITGLLAALAAASAVTVTVEDLNSLDPAKAALAHQLMANVEAGATVAFAHLLFNCAGAIIFLPFKPVRELPVKFAEWLAEICLRSRVIPVVFIIVVFYLIPIAVAWNTVVDAFRDTDSGSKQEESAVSPSEAEDQNGAAPPPKE